MKNTVAVMPSVLKRNVQFVNISLRSGKSVFKVGFSVFWAFRMFPFLICSSRISFVPGNSRGNPRSMIERMKIIIPKTTNPNHHAPIHLGSRVVNSISSGCKTIDRFGYKLPCCCCFSDSRDGGGGGRNKLTKIPYLVQCFWSIPQS